MNNTIPQSEWCDTLKQVNNFVNSLQVSGAQAETIMAIKNGLGLVHNSIAACSTPAACPPKLDDFPASNGQCTETCGEAVPQ